MQNNDMLYLVRLVKKNNIDEDLFREAVKLYENKILSFEELKLIISDDICKKHERLEFFLKLCKKSCNSNIDLLCLSRETSFDLEVLETFNNDFDNFYKKLKLINISLISGRTSSNLEIKDPLLKLIRYDVFTSYDGKFINRLMQKENDEEIVFLIDIINYYRTNLNKHKLLDYNNPFTKFLNDNKIPIDERIEIFDIISGEYEIAEKLNLYKILEALRKYGSAATSVIASLAYYYGINIENDLENDAMNEQLYYLQNLYSNKDFKEKDIKKFYEEDSLAKTILFDLTIPVEYKDYFYALISSPNILFNDEVVERIVNLSQTKAKTGELVSTMLRINDIASNPICYDFIIHEEDDDVLKLAYKAFKLQNVREDIEGLEFLNGLVTKEQKIEWLKKLKRRSTPYSGINKQYNDYLKGELGLEALSDILMKNATINTELSRKLKPKKSK